VKKETTAAGNIRFTADRSKSGHSDRFWALALALHAGGRASGPFACTPVSNKRGTAFNPKRVALV